MKTMESITIKEDKMNTEFMYSRSDDGYSWYEEIEEVIDDIELDETLADGQEIEIFRGDKGAGYTHEHFGAHLPDAIRDAMQEYAYNEADDSALDYLEDWTKEKAESLKACLLKWFNDNCKQPTFYVIKNIEPITLRIKKNGDTTEYEIIKTEEVYNYEF